MRQKITPNLWFDTEAEDAARFYTSVFPNSRIVGRTHYTDAGPREAGMVMTVEFELEGQRFVGINGGPDFTFDEAVSFEIECQDQEEIDYYWDALSAVPDAEQCGWLQDRFGVSWQVTPTALDELLANGTEEQIARVTQAFLQMKKFDIAELRRAYEGVETTIGGQRS